MALTKRQEKLYTHRCDLYQPADAVGAAGPEARTYSLHASGVACYFVTKSSIDVPQLVGLVESDDLMTSDQLHLDRDQVIGTNWVAVNRTTYADGTQAKDWGDAWTVSGNPKRVVGAGKRRSGHTVAFLKRTPKKPDGVA